MKLDRRKKYYKVIAEDGRHYNMQYKEGLNINVEPFNNNLGDTCCKGRMYITNKEILYRFYDYGDIVWEVKIPKDAKWIGEQNKIGVDKLILKKPMPLWKWILKNDAKEYHLQYLADYCPKHFDKWWCLVKDRWPDHNLWRLAQYCYADFEKWWPEVKHRYPDEDLLYLVANCGAHCDKWWSKVKDKLHDKELSYLACHCPNQFDIWWPGVKHRYPDEDLGYLVDYCSHYPKVQEYLKKKGYKQ